MTKLRPQQSLSVKILASTILTLLLLLQIFHIIMIQTRIIAMSLNVSINNNWKRCWRTLVAAAVSPSNVDLLQLSVLNSFKQDESFNFICKHTGNFGRLNKKQQMLGNQSHHNICWRLNFTSFWELWLLSYSWWGRCSKFNVAVGLIQLVRIENGWSMEWMLVF